MTKKEYDKAYYAANKEKLRKVNSKWYKLFKNTSYEKYLLIRLKHRAKARKLDFSLTLEDIIVPEICPLLGIKLDKHGSKMSPNLPSVDRIDNTKGYIKGNIVIVSLRANSLKKDATSSELLLLAKNLRSIEDARI